MIKFNRRALITGAAALSAYGSLAKAWPRRGVGSGGGGGANTWDPATLPANISLDGAKLIATASSATAGVVRGTIGLTSGSPYFDVTGIGTTSGVKEIGICLAAHTNTSDLSAAVNSSGMTMSDGYVYFPNSPGFINIFPGGPGFLATDVIRVQVLFGSSQMQMSKNGAAFQTNKADLTGLLTGPVFPAIEMFASGTSVSIDLTGWV